MRRIAPTVGRRVAVSAVLALLVASVVVMAPPMGALAKSNANEVTIDVKGHPLSTITTSPLSLTPAFDPTITDYVLRCQSGINTIQVTLNALRGGSTNVEGNRGSTVTIQESLFENQALVISAIRPHGSGGEERTDGPNNSDRRSVQYWIRCLPHDFPRLTVTKLRNPAPGWYLTGNLTSVGGSGIYAMVLDNNGTPVWYRKSRGTQANNVTALFDGTIAWWSNGTFEDYNLRTQTTRVLAAPMPPTDFHELKSVSDEDLLMLSAPLISNVDLTVLGLSSSATIIDCVIQEVNRMGQLVWQWRASDHIAMGESTHPLQSEVAGQLVYDPFHCNSIDDDPATGNLLVSVRHADAIYLVNKTTGAIIWKMGGSPTNRDHAQILAVTNDPEGAFHAQHDARFQPNGDVSLYDDQSWDSSLAARGVEYHIDTTAGRATLVWSYQAPDGHNSAATGSFRRLYRGTDNIIGWGFKPNSLFTEVDGAGRIMLDVAFTSGELAYRVVKVAPSAAFDHTLLRETAGLPPSS